MTIQQAAGMAGVLDQTITAAHRRGAFKVRKHGNRVEVDNESFRAWLAAKKERAETKEATRKIAAVLFERLAWTKKQIGLIMPNKSGLESAASNRGANLIINGTEDKSFLERLRPLLMRCDYDLILFELTEKEKRLLGCAG